MKKTAAYLALCVMLILTACGGQGGTKGNDNEVTIWVHTSKEEDEGKVIQETIDKFNKAYEGEYSATIEFIPRSGSGGGYEDKINAALTTDSLPDVLTLDGPNTAAYAESGIIAPIDAYITDQDDFLPSIIDQGTYNDQLYAIGYSESGVGIYYNKEMFEAAGIDLSTLPTVEDPWDWNQFMELSEKLKQKYDVPAVDMGFDDKSEWLMYAFTPFLWSQGGNVVSEDGKQAEGVLNNEDGVKTITFIQEMMRQGYTTISPAENAFETGKYPMKFSGSWTMQQLDENYKDIDYGVMPYPTSPDTNELVSPTGSWQYAMSASTEKKEAAGELIAFMTTTEATVDISLGNSVLPPRHSAVEALKDKVSPEMNVLIEQNAKSGRARPVIPEYPQISRAFQQTISDAAYYEEISNVQELLDQKAGEMQNALD